MKKSKPTYSTHTIHTSNIFDDFAIRLKLTPEYLGHIVLEFVGNHPEQLCLVADSPTGLPRVLGFARSD